MRLVPPLSQASSSGKTAAGSGRSMANLADETAMVPELRSPRTRRESARPRFADAPVEAQDIVGLGVRIANIAPCGSTNIARRPTSGMSLGGTITLAACDLACSVVLSQSATQT